MPTTLYIRWKDQAGVQEIAVIVVTKKASVM